MSRPVYAPIAGKTVVITGAGSGMGRALAQRLSRLGSPVVISDANPDTLQETVDALAGPVLHRTLDVRDKQGQLALAAEAREWSPAPFGAVFNNAGVALSSNVIDASPEDDDWVLDINLNGVIHGVRAWLPILVEQGSGAIVNTSSVFGLIGFKTQSAYCASKFAVRGFTDSLRWELKGTGVRAITVHPGGITTNIVANGRMKADPRGGTRTAEDIAKEFEMITMTSPDKAAKIIHKGVDAGKARILVGPDAYLFDAIARTLPTHYPVVFDGFDRLMTRFGR